MELWPATGAEPRGCVALWLPSHTPHGGQLRWKRAACLHWGLHTGRAGLDDEIGDVRLCRRLDRRHWLDDSALQIRLLTGSRDRRLEVRALRLPHLGLHTRSLLMLLLLLLPLRRNDGTTHGS